jgi:hypothetical protein
MLESAVSDLTPIQLREYMDKLGTTRSKTVTFSKFKKMEFYDVMGIGQCRKILWAIEYINENRPKIANDYDALKYKIEQQLKVFKTKYIEYLQEFTVSQLCSEQDCIGQSHEIIQDFMFVSGFLDAGSLMFGYAVRAQWLEEFILEHGIDLDAAIEPLANPAEVNVSPEVAEVQKLVHAIYIKLEDILGPDGVGVGPEDSQQLMNILNILEGIDGE